MNPINDIEYFSIVTGSGINGCENYVQTPVGLVPLDDYKNHLVDVYDCGDKKVISKEKYEGLMESERVLNALFAAGVDNWEGYDYAIEILET